MTGSKTPKTCVKLYARLWQAVRLCNRLWQAERLCTRLWQAGSRPSGVVVATGNVTHELTLPLRHHQFPILDLSTTFPNYLSLVSVVFKRRTSFLFIEYMHVHTEGKDLLRTVGYSRYCR